MKPVVYVAGPLTSSGLAWDNVRHALDVRVALLRAGFLVLSPHLDTFTSMANPMPEHFWLGYGLDCVRQSDAVYRMLGQSVGADAEVALAEELEIPIFHNVDAVRRFFDSIDTQKAFERRYG